jgi:hypothetical protein
MRPPDLSSGSRDLKGLIFRIVDIIAFALAPSHMVFCSNMTSGLNFAKHLLRANFFVGPPTPLTLSDSTVMSLTSLGPLL